MPHRDQEITMLRRELEILMGASGSACFVSLARPQHLSLGWTASVCPWGPSNRQIWWRHQSMPSPKKPCRMH